MLLASGAREPPWEANGLSLSLAGVVRDGEVPTNTHAQDTAHGAA